MPSGEVEIFVRGERQGATAKAACEVVRALQAAGASVALSTILPLSEPSGDGLRGVRVVVGVREETVPAVATRSAIALPAIALPPAVGSPRPSPARGVLRSAKAALGVGVLLVVLLFELRLRFGLGAVVTLGVGGWLVWHTCLRRPEETTA